MPRTQTRVDGDIGYADGQIFVSALDMASVGAGAVTATKNASGSYSLNIAASQTVVLTACLSNMIFRYGVNDYLQEQFGSAQSNGATGLPVGGYTTLSTASATGPGNNVSVPVLSSVNFAVGRSVTAGTQKTFITAIADTTHITLAALTATLASGSLIAQDNFTTPAGVTGPPPFTGVSQFTPVTSPRPKGIKFREIYPVYAVAGAALTLNTIGITKTVFTNVTAPTITNVLANAANGMNTATNAQPYITPVMLAASPVYQNTKYSSFNVEWDVTTAGGGTAQIFGVYIDIEFNYV